MEQSSERRKIEVVAAVIIENGKVFTTQRGYGDFKDGWEFPGGKMEVGETGEQALARELREELAIKVEVGRLLKTIKYSYPKFDLTMHCYLTKIIEGTPNLLEHEAARWVDKNNIDTVAWLPADLEVIDEIKKLLQWLSHSIFIEPLIKSGFFVTSMVVLKRVVHMIYLTSKSFIDEKNKKM